MLMKTPMVTAYKVSWFSHEIFKRLIKTPFFTLPNLLAGKEIVPELIQDDASVENLVSHVKPMLEHTNTQMIDQFTKLHVEIKRDASARAANSVWQLLDINNK